MSTILIKDALRASVEAASGGSQTVLYTAKGQPTFMNIIKKFDVADVITGLAGTHPAFVINGVEKSEIFIGTYEGTIRNGELLSLPNSAPTIANYNAYFAAAIANGVGHHMMTNAEWAALALRSWKDGAMPIGNGYYGRAAGDVTQYGRRVDGLDATLGTTTGNPCILSGTGPVSFRHNGKYNGISDLAGNVKDMLQGVRLVYGELQIIPNNDAASVLTSEAEELLWRAIDARTGDLIVPNGSGTTQYSVRISSNQDNKDDYTLLMSGPNSANKQASTANPVSGVAINLLKKLALWIPTNESTPSVGWGRNIVSESAASGILSRGGHFSEGASGANIYSFRIGDTRTITTSALGSRPAYYKP